jgi:hypothetical protein
VFNSVLYLTAIYAKPVQINAKDVQEGMQSTSGMVNASQQPSKIVK